MNAQPETRPEPQSEPEPEQSGLTPQERSARRRRLAEVFGDVLPEQTSDDADDPRTGTDGSDAWLKRQVPPHHGQ